jgi:hypothetical protein
MTNAPKQEPSNLATHRKPSARFRGRRLVLGMSHTRALLLLEHHLLLQGGRLSGASRGSQTSDHRIETAEYLLPNTRKQCLWKHVAASPTSMCNVARHGDRPCQEHYTIAQA